MFVASDARQRVLERRREAFARDFVEPLLAEARRLGLSATDVRNLIDKGEHGA
jgi:DNA-binding transcriptional regulator YhcF (GntR family)